MIKNFLAVVFFSLSFQIFAGDIDGVCGLDSCTVKMKSILNEYQEGSTDMELPGVFSGECFHKSRMYNPNHAHYGGILVDKNDKLYFGGSFYFFAPDNPYRDLDIDSARERFKIKYEEKYLVTKKDTGFYVDLNPDQIPLWRYYFSQKDGLINLIGVWGVEHIMFCQMTRH
ncbi:MAG: hypothetical protein CME70_21135 [Halobacteriovorax sp.]|nr:hypothetical protein [Halobacteriovorax sp.]